MNIPFALYKKWRELLSHGVVILRGGWKSNVGLITLSIVLMVDCVICTTPVWAQRSAFETAQVFAQSSTTLVAAPMSIDSLAALVASLDAEQRTDTVLAQSLNALARLWLTRNPEKSLTYIHRALQVSQTLNFKLGELTAMQHWGSAVRIQGKYAEAATHYQQARALAQSIDYTEGIAAALNGLGMTLHSQGKYDEALEYYFGALKAWEGVSSTANAPSATTSALSMPANMHGTATALNNIGSIYRNQGKYDKALEFYLRAFKLWEQVQDKKGMSAALNNTGLIYMNQGSYDMALAQYQRALQIDQSLGDRQGVAVSYNNIGIIYQYQGNDDKALETYLKALKISEELGDRQNASETLKNISSVLNKRGHSPEALQYATQALLIAERIGARAQIRDVLETLSIIYGTLGKHKESLNFYKRYVALKDSLWSKDIAEKLARLHAEYESERKDKEIKLLNKDRQLTEAELSKERFIRNTLIAGCVLVLAASAALIVLYNRNRRATQEILRQQAILEEQSAGIEIANAQLQETLETLKNTQSQLVQSERMNAVGLLTAGVMHEINNPNAAVIAALYDADSSLSQAAQQASGVSPEVVSDIREVLGLAATSAKRVQTIVQGLQHFSKHQREGMYESRLAEEIASTIDVVRYQFKSVRIEQFIPTEIILKANFGELNQVFLNLLVNAVQAQATYICIRALQEQTAGKVVVQIEDNGKGMNPMVQQRMFEPFFSTKGEQHSGLGLSISQQILERHRASMRVQSEEQRGTTVTLTFAAA